MRVLAALTCLLLISACSKPLSVEQQIINTIEQMEIHFEAGESRAFVGYLTDDFKAPGAGMNRDQIRAFLILQLKRYKELDARILSIQVNEREPGKATAKFNALVTGGPGWIPENGQLYAFETFWRLESGDWLLEAAYWEPATLKEVL